MTACKTNLLDSMSTLFIAFLYQELELDVTLFDTINYKSFKLLAIYLIHFHI